LRDNWAGKDTLVMVTPIPDHFTPSVLPDL
jgi:hypothetical protein